MLKHHRDGRLRSIAGALVIAGTFGSALCLSAPTLAQEAASKPVPERKIFIREIGPDGARRELPAELRELTAKCPEAQKLESDIRSGEPGKEEQRTRIIVCAKDGKAASPETRERLLAALERARADLSTSSDLKVENRAKAIEALRREIDRVRSEAK